MKRPRTTPAQRRQAIEDNARESVRLVARLAQAKRRPRPGRPAVADVIEDLRSLYPKKPPVRDPTTRQFTFKTRDLGKIHFAIASHMWGRWPVPRHLESVWHEAADLPIYRTAPNDHGRPGSTREAIKRRRDWYVCAAGGGSLWKEHTHRFMSKKETHVFLTVPFPLAFHEAIVFALARSHCADTGLCLRLARTKLALRDVIVDKRSKPAAVLAAAFWKDAIRFFCANPASLEEINDLVDFLDHARSTNAAYAFKGRTLRSMNSAMRQWHRDLTRVRLMGDHVWDGLGLPDRVYIRVAGEDKGLWSDWQFAELKSGKALAEEGNAMHHCVFAYQASCRDRRSSIWSMRARHSGSGASYVRRITFEVSPMQRRIVQVRGYANRPATVEETIILRRWAAEHGIT